MCKPERVTYCIEDPESPTKKLYAQFWYWDGKLCVEFVPRPLFPITVRQVAEIVAVAEEAKGVLRPPNAEDLEATGRVQSSVSE